MQGKRDRFGHVPGQVFLYLSIGIENQEYVPEGYFRSAWDCIIRTSGRHPAIHWA